MAYFVYVLLCEDGSYYTGYAKDVKSRFRLHKQGIGARYTRIHRPIRVVYVEEFRSRREAMRREQAIKRLSHERKRKLVGSCDV
jgi:putative endonuclease